MTAKESPIFTKTYDLLLWVLQHTDKFPKNERFRLAKRMEDALFGLYELFLECAGSKDCREDLQYADFLLLKLSFYTRVGLARGLFNLRQVEYAANAQREIGRLLGGWIESLPLAVVEPGGTGKRTARRFVEQQYEQHPLG